MRVLAAALVLWTAAASATAQMPQAPGAWREAPAYAALFGPAGPRAKAYRFYVSPLPLAKVLEQLATDPSLLRPPGAWMSELFLPADTFGETGRYDRAKLARLYGATRAAVARGPRGEGGRPSESWTLVSPYPALDMSRLEPGTLLIVLDLQFP